MTDTTKGVWHRPEAERGAYAREFDRIFGGGNGVQVVHESAAEDGREDGPGHIQPPAADVPTGP